ncbi:hypothetical protein CDAR_179201 [Caerostris darwini]|uniref:Secreted protein n=1 Tax=Caerostris darwini TaxID=1538125 RepID=A0AAV4P9D9_9ARAC|nr:hypothetical protein CDAR_179201 [Caerostris darwini]
MSFFSCCLLLLAIIVFAIIGISKISNERELCLLFNDWTDYVWIFFKYFDTLRCYENIFFCLSSSSLPSSEFQRFLMKENCTFCFYDWTHYVFFSSSTSIH